MENNRILLVLIFLFFPLVFLTAESFELCEKGDLIFRSGVPAFGHTGIYCDWYETNYNNPSNPINQNIVEAPGQIHSVWEVSLSYFYASGNFWGARVNYPQPNCSQREQIVEFVRRKIGCRYDFKEGYKGDSVLIDSVWYECYRCDGLAEAAYEYAGLDIVNDINWMTLSPYLQMQAMFPASGWEPEILTTSPEDGDIVEGEVTIMAVVDDGIYGSGLTRAEFFIDGSLLEIDSADAQCVHAYEAEWDASLISDGSHYIKILAYDKAGNIGEKRIKVYKGDAPFVVSTVPYDGAQDVAIDTTISITFSAVMDQMTTSGAVSIEPPVSFTPFWWSPDGMTLDLDLNDNLDYCQEYTVTITDDAMSEDSIQLDGDGKPDLAVRII